MNNNFHIGSRLTSNYCGDYIVLEYAGIGAQEEPCYRVRFLDTNNECDVSINHIMSGEVFDPKHRFIANVGYPGGWFAPTEDNNRLYDTWSDMINKCYDNNYNGYTSNGKVGVTVHPEWHEFIQFMNDAKTLNGYNDWIDHNEYVLDKDTIQSTYDRSDKIYSKDTCIFNHPAKIITNNVTNYKTPSSGYYGVYTNGPNSNYLVQLRANNVRYQFGTYDNPEAAAVVYNYYAKQYSKPINNNVTMPLHEALNHRTLRNGQQFKVMCTIIGE